MLATGGLAHPPPRTRLLATAARPNTAARELELYLQHAERQQKLSCLEHRRQPLKALTSNRLLPPPLPQPSSYPALPPTWQQVQQKYDALLKPSTSTNQPAPLRPASFHDDQEETIAAQLSRYESLLHECAAECELPPPPALIPSAALSMSSAPTSTARPPRATQASGSSSQAEQREEAADTSSPADAPPAAALASANLGAIEKAAAMRRKMAAMRRRSRGADSASAALSPALVDEAKAGARGGRQKQTVRFDIDDDE